MKELVKIVIPIYNPELMPEERFSLQQCFQILSGYPKVIVKPSSLSVDKLAQEFPDVVFESFDDAYFKNIEGYNQLMLSPSFYERFLDSEYILIYQLDAFVFRDELKEWALKGYDYIGAPWIPRAKYSKPLLRLFCIVRDGVIKSFHIKEKRPYLRDIRYKVGNGGFSLRRVQTFFTVTTNEKETIASYSRPINESTLFTPEDVFWALEPARKGYDFSVPDYKEAMFFSFDKYPEECFPIAKKIPFGCHAWNRRKEYEFWKNYIHPEYELKIEHEAEKPET